MLGEQVVAMPASIDPWDHGTNVVDGVGGDAREHRVLRHETQLAAYAFFENNFYAESDSGYR